MDGGISCVYCSAPYPKVTGSTKKTAKIGALISGALEENTQLTPLIECSYCQRKYRLISAEENRQFNEKMIRSLQMSEGCIELLIRYQLSDEDILSGCKGITRIDWIKDSITNKFKPYLERENHFHLIFVKGQNSYYLNILRSDGRGAFAVNLEKIIL